LHPWLTQREAEGHRIAFVANTLSAEGMRAGIRAVAGAGRLRYVVLVGDAEPGVNALPDARTRCTPTHLAPAQVNVQWGSEGEIATDNWFADLDDDDVPDVAIGRLTAQTREEVSLIVHKILEYERPFSHGEWQRQIHVVAGAGDLGRVTDALLETAARKFLTDGIPAAFSTTMTYAHWQSPYCPDPRLFRDVVTQRLNDGCLFWVYVGHGQPRRLDYVVVPGGAFPILTIADARQLQCPRGSPIAVLLACYAGAFDRPTDCLAEALLKARGGPVAAVCASRVTMPYGMAVLSEAFMDEYFQQRRPTLGEVLLHVKRRLTAEDRPSENRQLLDALATALSPSAGQLAEERKEHVLMFNLLGDPLLRMPQPLEVSVHVAPQVAAGEILKIIAHSPIPASGVVELVCRRDRTKTPFAPRSEFEPTDDFLRSFNAAYAQANDPVWLSQPLSTEGGEFETELTVPQDVRGPCHVRICLHGVTELAIGAASVFVRRPRQEPALPSAN
jgi:hypothetical protein